VENKQVLIVLLFVGSAAVVAVAYVIMKRGQRRGKYMELLFFPKQHPMEDIFRF
jgi:hypothetical protein